MNKIGIITICCLLSSMNVAAQEQTSTDSVDTQQSRSNYFIGAQAQFNNFTYKKDQCKVNVFDTYARISLGVRL